MEDAIKQIGERLKGLRDVLDIPAQDVADLCGVSLEAYLKAEDGEAELSISSMQKISRKYGIALDVLLFGEEPHTRGRERALKGARRTSIRAWQAASAAARQSLSWCS